MKKLLSVLLCLVMVCSSAAALAASDVTVLVPNADHGWTGAVLTYAQEKVDEINKGGTLTAECIPCADSADQIAKVEDVIENSSAKTVVILPYDNTLESAMGDLADSGIPYVMFDRIIDSAVEKSVSAVKGDNHGIGYETAKRFVTDGIQPGDAVLIMPGDNSSVPEMRNAGFFDGLKEAGWTDEQIAAIKSTAYTGWSRATGKQLFVEWLDASTVDEITNTKYIFTHDDEIAMGILEALKSGEIDASKQDAFLNAGVHLATSSGLNEIYSVLKGTHMMDYTAEVSKLADLFSVTYDPAMIQIAIQCAEDSLSGKEVVKDNVVPVSVVDASNVEQFRGFGDAMEK